MHSLRNKKRKAGGFTLGEMLATVAIIGILLAIAIPSALTIQRDLKLLELDNAARDIFIAAQNRLTALRASDGLKTVDSKKPSIDDVNAPDDIGPLVYVDNTDGMFDVLLPARSIDRSLFDGNAKAVIEYNPQSGSVYAVFYSEQSFTYDANTPRTHTERRDNDPMLGYYGGDAAQVPGSDTIKPPAISIENAEELKLIIDNSGIEGIDDPAYQKVLEQLSYTVTLTQTDKEQNTVTLPEIPATGFQGNKYELVLDSLSGPHFADLVRKDGAVAIDPGADIRVSVEIEYTGDEFVARKYTWTGETNSLFAARGDTEIENGETKETLKDAVQIACGRHLQNLDPAVSGLGQGKEPTNAYQPVNVVLTSDIDWKARKDMGNTTACGGSSIGDDGETIEPATLAKEEEFCSIQNEHIKRIEGAKHEIKNLRIVGHDKAQNVGLLATLAGTSGTAASAAVTAQMNDVYLVNPRLDGGNGTALGVLAGTASRAELSGCRVYLDETGRKALAGGNQKQEEKYGIFSASTGAIAGGLVGKMTSGKIEKSFAALPEIRTNGRAGGLCGELSDVTLDQCYASITALSGAFVGGFAYQTAEGVSIANCYVTGTLNATEVAAGFIREMTSAATVQYCHTAVSYANDGFQKEKDLSFCPVKGTNGRSQYNYYITGIVDGPVQMEENPAHVEARTYKVMKEQVGKYGPKDEDGSAIWGNNAAVTTKPYTMKAYKDLGELKNKVDEKLYSNTVYPFPRLAALYHYGDWPLPAKTGILAYYERYTDGSLGLVCATAADELPDTLKDKYPLSDTTSVLRDGYLWLTEGEAKTLTLSIGGANKELQAAAAFQLQGFTAFELPEQDAAPAEYYLGVAPAGQEAELWYNPYFAQTAVHSQAAPQSRPDSISVRTARQLTALGGDAAYWTDAYTFRQGRSIDYTSYDQSKNLTLPSIGADKDSFDGKYDGGYYPITTTGSDKGGLFDQNEGTLQNIVLRAAASGQTISGSGTVGALVNNNSGSITNCAVSGFAVSTTGSAAAGGLAGTSAGSITNSAADNASVSGLSAGGLVGNMNGGSVESCYALGTLTATQQNVGGITASMSNTARVSNSYSACTIEKAAGNVYGVAPTSATNCAYLAQQVNGNVQTVNGVTAKNYAELQTELSGAFAKVTEANTHPYASKGAYPFPSSVKNKNAFVHYGDWPEKKEEQEGREVVLGIAVRTKNAKSETVLRVVGGVKQVDGTFTVQQGKDIPLKNVAGFGQVAAICLSSDAGAFGTWYADWGNGKKQVKNDLQELSHEVAQDENYTLYNPQSLQSQENIMFYQGKNEKKPVFTIQKNDWPTIS